MKAWMVAGVLALAVGSAAQAADVLDQSNPWGGVGYNGVDHQWQQEVTAGVDGRLTGLTLYGRGQARIRVARGEAFSSGPFLFNQVVDFASGDSLFIDTRAANILLSAGEMFVIDFSEGTEGYSGAATPYAGGDLWLSGGGYPAAFNFTAATGFSMGFETYMGAVPEPSTWALTLAGFGLAGAALRRRRGFAVGL